MKYGVICAMPEEIKELIEAMDYKQEVELGSKKYYEGMISNQDVVLVESGIGKVEAGITTEHLISEFNVDIVINSGSAGGIGEGLKVGDIVVSTETAYHDVDVTAFGYDYGQLPGQPVTFKASKEWSEAIIKAGESTGLTVLSGLIVSGDQFVANSDTIASIKAKFPNALSSEMEGAAVGQVSNDHNIPYVVVRAMSDTGDEEASVSFDDFIIDAGKRSAKMLLTLFANQNK
ncbi:methylthioadenosine nucleosidase [Paucilactobacillus oligofermentans DSM 15707 = LMG 22743]|uniref:adenosylhomocysteine nucleosidase n=1 Tax=Paucilactobacillus oligofermentans DSM 15707 = LMG 22743 TaxID=1423778 RepID=A0A0R1RHB3_9LACO|nr:5'-methylthioadenosine/adenosylhomocysteine nucleosidase [Paucilactobacillus oligofermentans]KRL54612.1 methylthioadenosine nucleosidase [Paucilactobacillus oligofermentans DSM 15707 = LMG 22743]CUS26479.1 5'-methylthioadenosine nucleosidase [Paucilactobacillus oligofermentans DSM 15707 = LMG 22743]